MTITTNLLSKVNVTTICHFSAPVEEDRMIILSCRYHY